MKKLSRIALMSILLLTSTLSKAQAVEMADTMRSEGKIYVVVAIILSILAGFIAYLFMLDRKLTKLEKQLNSKTK